MSTTDNHQDPEDILSESLDALYGYRPITLASAGTIFLYTPKGDSFTINLRIPDTHAANWSLHASDIWISSVYLADHLNELRLEDHIKTGQIPLRVLELGAAAGLPGILIAKKFPDCAVTVSDYPDEQLIQNLAHNVERNDLTDNCRAVAYAWGADTSALVGDSKGFDVVIASDTLWNPELHEIFIKALRAALLKAPSSRAHLVAGLHTGRYTIQSFLDMLAQNEFELEGISERLCSGCGEREWTAFRDGEDDRERRRWVVWMTIKWPLLLSATG